MNKTEFDDVPNLPTSGYEKDKTATIQNSPMSSQKEIETAIHPIAISMASFVDLCVLLAVSLIAFGFVITGKRINRAEGFTMIIMYLAYTAFSIWRG